MLNKFFSYFLYFRFDAHSKDQRLKIIVQFILNVVIDIIIFPFLFIFCICIRYLKPNQKQKVFIGCFPNNNYIYVAQALRNMGYDAITCPLFIPENEKGIINYDYDIENSFPILYKNWFGMQFILFYIFIFAVANYEIFIMPFQNRLLDRRPILQWFEYQLLKIAKRFIILNPYASDIYTPQLTLKGKKETTVLKDYQSDPLYSKINENYVLKSRHYGERYAHKIVAALDLVDYLTRVDHLLQMRCVDLDSIKQNYSQNNTVLKIIHAPNHRLLKGTEYLIKAVQNINRNGTLVGLEIIEGTENKILLEKIKGADCVADQFLMGAYGRLAIESMACGKPVLCYLRDDLMKLYPHWQESPIVNTSISDIEKKLLMFLDLSKEERVEIGKKSRHYVEKYHSLNYIGTEVDKIIQSL